MVYQEIRYDVDDPVAIITLNRPEKLNAWTPRMGFEVRHAVAAATADPAVVGIVLTGAGRAFCAGADLEALAALQTGGAAVPEPPEELRVETEEDIPDFLAGEYGYLLACPKPVIAAVNGPVVGMAVSVMLHCDLRFIADSATVITAFAERGLVAEWGASWLLPRLVGHGAAMDLLLSSRRLGGTEAAEAGLANAVLPADELLGHATGWVRDVAARCSPASLAQIKRQLWADAHGGYADAAAGAARLMVRSFRRPDFREGVKAFMQRRSPEFARLTGKPGGDSRRLPGERSPG